VDKFDQQILALLREDARISITRLAEAVSLSRSAVAERVRQLETRGIIRGYHAQVADPAGSEVKAFFELFYTNGRCEEQVQRLRALPEVRRCCSISGETDMLVYVEAASMARLVAIRDFIEALPGMQRLKTHMVVADWDL